jgi:RimJ/RimL family protein N-acetyltransferase
MPTDPSPPLHWKPVPAPAPTTLHGRYVALEPLNPERHSAALWEAVRGHDELWTWLAEGPFATEADLRHSIRQKQAGTSAVFFAILPAESRILEGAGALMPLKEGENAESRFPEGAGTLMPLKDAESAESRFPEGAGALMPLKDAESAESRFPEGAGALMPLKDAESAESRFPEGAGALMPLKEGENAESRSPEGAGAFMPLKEAENARPSGPASSSAAKAAGWASYMRIEPAHGVVEVGNILLSPSLQRTRAATEAMYLMARHIFEDLGYRRYEWKCNALNEPSRRAALRLGFTFEGIFRQHMVIKDLSRDTAWFSMLDQEWSARKLAFETWLDPANFDNEGRQLQCLIECSQF